MGLGNLYFGTRARERRSILSLSSGLETFVDCSTHDALDVEARHQITWSNRFVLRSLSVGRAFSFARAAQTIQCLRS
jgi:hypothetical protein